MSEITSEMCFFYFQHSQNKPTSFPGSLFSASIVVEKTTIEAEKRDPGNEVENKLIVRLRACC